jgi:hypothetical protein
MRRVIIVTKSGKLLHEFSENTTIQHAEFCMQHFGNPILLPDKETVKNMLPTINIVYSDIPDWQKPYLDSIIILYVIVDSQIEYYSEYFY